MTRVRLAGAAIRDLEEILEYLRSLSPQAAQRIGLAIVGKIDMLSQFPESGRLLEKRDDVQYRQTVAAGYLIGYRTDAQEGALVLSIRHGRRRRLPLEDLERRGLNES